MNDGEPTVIGLHHGGITVTDLIASEEWYWAVLRTAQELAARKSRFEDLGVVHSEVRRRPPER